MNIGIVAHVDAGKTTLTEQLLYRSGELRKKGIADDGTAQTDWLSIERSRGISVKLSTVRITKGVYLFLTALCLLSRRWKAYRRGINPLDTAKWILNKRNALA